GRVEAVPGAIGALLPRAAVAQLEPAPADADLDPHAAPRLRGTRQSRPEADAVAVVDRVAGRKGKVRAGRNGEVEVSLQRACRARPVGDPDLAAGPARDPGPEAPLGIGERCHRDALRDTVHANASGHADAGARDPPPAAVENATGDDRPVPVPAQPRAQRGAGRDLGDRAEVVDPDPTVGAGSVR